MTTEQPTRLVHEDAEFARLVAASHKEAPPSADVERALSLANQLAPASRWTAWRWFGSNLAIGLAVLGAATAGAVAGSRALRAGDAVATSAVAPTAAPDAPSRPSSADPCAPDGTRESDPPATAEQAPAEQAPAVTTISVNDLAAAPPDPVAVGTRRSAAKALASGAALPRLDRAEPSTPSRTTFAEELALVSAARSAIEHGDAPSCMRAVGEYQERFRSGIFAHEIEVLRIEALFASGERERARTSAEQLLAAHPKSPYAERIRLLVERNDH